MRKRETARPVGGGTVRHKQHGRSFANKRTKASCNECQSLVHGKKEQITDILLKPFRRDPRDMLSWRQREVSTAKKKKKTRRHTHSRREGGNSQRQKIASRRAKERRRKGEDGAEEAESISQVLIWLTLPLPLSPSIEEQRCFKKAQHQVLKGILFEAPSRNDLGEIGKEGKGYKKIT